MRFEFTQDGTPVGAAQWEGPGQVTLEVRDPADRRKLAEYFAAETTYLSTGFGQEEAFQIRRRDWTPWEFERACLALAHRMGFRVERTPSGAVEVRPSGGNGHAKATAAPVPRMATAAYPPPADMAAKGDHGNGRRTADPAPGASS
ncbi:MAG: hypothetical protein ACJ77A_17460 [Actinomycetota bacterium]